MSNGYKGAMPPPADRRILILKILNSETQEFVSCCEVPLGVQVHWYGSRSHECTKESSECEGCKKNWPFRWYGYLHVLTGHPLREHFVEITGEAYHALKSKVPDANDWRGVRFSMRRTKGGKYGRLLTDVKEARMPVEMLPRERSPLELLRFLWNVRKQSGVVVTPDL